MKLSEAIRLGSMVTAPIKGPFTHKSGGEVCGACALGAAAVALGFKGGSHIEPYLHYQWPALLQTAIPQCPEPTCTRHCNRYPELINRIIQLFECHGWTRERIADWVEQIERQQEQAHADALPAREVVR